MCRTRCWCWRHLSAPEDANPDAWRAALRVFEHAYGKAPEQVDEPAALPDSPEAMAALIWTRLQQLAGRHLSNGHDPPPQCRYGTRACFRAPDSPEAMAALTWTRLQQLAGRQSPR